MIKILNLDSSAESQTPKLAGSINMLTNLPPLSLYIHIPWCVRKCPYCDFNSHQISQGLPEKSYSKYLLDDLEQDLEYVQNRKLHSIFIGGGTPSLFSGKTFFWLLHEIEKRIPFGDNIEITMEANPGTVEQQRFEDFHTAGINRLSMGIQSFQHKHLKNLGRIHDDHEARQAIITAQNSGFDNINLDLMHGLPEQTPDEALNDLKIAIDFQPAHISWYQLTLEKNTEFFNRPPTLPDEDVLWNIQTKGQKLLNSHGYKQYEVSAYSQAGKISKHNCNYWEFGDYIGIGAGAHGKITDLNKQEFIRTQKTRTPKDYMDKEKNFCSSRKNINKDDLALEFFMNVLRLRQGIGTESFYERTGLTIKSIRNELNKAVKLGLMDVYAKKLKASDKGFLYLNNLLEIFS